MNKAATVIMQEQIRAIRAELTFGKEQKEIIDTLASLDPHKDREVSFEGLTPLQEPVTPVLIELAQRFNGLSALIDNLDEAIAAEITKSSDS